MKPEQSERFFIEQLIKQSQSKGVVQKDKIDLIDKLTGDASTRRYYRVQMAETHYVVCLDNPTEEGKQNDFVVKQKFLKGFSIRVPEIYDDDPSKGYILEEDLGDQTLLNKLALIKDAVLEREIYSQVIDQLLSLHRISASEVTQSGLYQEKFDLEKYQQEINFTLKFFMKRILGVSDEKLLKDLSVLIQPILERLAAEPMVLTHRDFHSRNIMVKDNDFIMIDFQDARWGIPHYDLVSMLDDCYYQLSVENYQFLKSYYYKACGCYQNDPKKFESLYQDMLFQRVFKAIGSFSYIYETRKDFRYLKYIGFAMEKIKASLQKDNRNDDLRKLLFGVYYDS